MKIEEAKEILIKVQNLLESLQGTDETYMFFCKRDNRGVVSGDDGVLSALIVWNMLRYDVMANIIKKAVSTYDSLDERVKQDVRGCNPTHEVFTIDEINQLKS